MATLLDATFESGTNGATITVANSPFTEFVDTGWTFVNTPILPSGAGGSLAARSVAAGTISCAMTAPITATSTPYLRTYLYVSQRPTANTPIVQYLGTDNVTVRAELQLTATGALRMRGSDFIALATAPADTIPLNAWCRIEWKFDNTAVRQEVRVFSGTNLHGTTASWTSGNLATPASGTVGFVYLGAIPNSAVMTSVWDNIKVDNVTWVGPAVAVEPAPVANAGADQSISPHTAATYTLNGGASTGTITTYLWEDITGTATTVAGSGATRSITTPKSPTDLTRIYRLTVTGPGGSSTDSVNVAIAHYRNWRMDGTTLTPINKVLTYAGDVTPPTVPGTPVAVAGVNSATVTTSGSTDASGVTAYEWYRNNGAAPVATTTGTQLTQNGLTAGSAYTYRVRARDAAGNWSALSLVSNSVTPTGSATAGQIIYGACPHNSGGVSGALSKWFTTRPIAIRQFDGGAGINGPVPTRPGGIGVLHYSMKVGGNATFTRAQIVRIAGNMEAGDILEVEHEHDNDSQFAALTVSKRNFAAAVRAAREAGDIPNILTCDTFTGWALALDDNGQQVRTNAYLDARAGDADLVGTDMDGIDPQGWSSFSFGWPTTGTPLYFNFVDREYPTTISFMNRNGYTGWCVPEFSTFRHPTSDANGNIRVQWMNWQVGKLNALAVKPYYVAAFDFSNRPDVPSHLECFELANEIAAWKAAIATNPL